MLTKNNCSLFSILIVQLRSSAFLSIGNSATTVNQLK